MCSACNGDYEDPDISTNEDELSQVEDLEDLDELDRSTREIS
jgi:hypothetical protein